MKKIFMLTVEKAECHVSGVSKEGSYSREKICPSSLVFSTAHRLLRPAEPKQNSNFPYSQALWEAGAQGGTLGDQSILPGSVLEPGFGVSPRAWMISTSSCPFRSCKPISTSPKPKCQNIQKTFKTMYPWVTKMLKKQSSCPSCTRCNKLHVPDFLLCHSAAAPQWLQATFSKANSTGSPLKWLWWPSLLLFVAASLSSLPNGRS